MNRYVDKLKDSLYWWLGFNRPFIINEEYKVELLYIDKNHQSVKIRITNLKNNQIVEQDVAGDIQNVNIG